MGWDLVAEASRAALSFATALPLGAASDRWGRRPLIALSSICAGAPLACLALAPGRLSLYLVAFVLAGLLGGQFTPAVRRATSTHPTWRRATESGR